MVFLLIVPTIVALDFAWWIWADRAVRRLPRPRLWRSGVALFATAQALGLLSILFWPAMRGSSGWPIPVVAGVFLWHLLIVPLWAAALLLGSVVASVARLLPRSAVLPRAVKPADDPPPRPGPTRREFLLGTAAVVPPLLLAPALVRSMDQLGHLRVRPIDLFVPRLPRELDGMVIAHVTDTHVGRFTTPAMLNNVVSSVNAMDADLVLFTGDLIDFSISDLPTAIDMIGRCSSRHGLFLCEGNHDLFGSRDAFRQRVLDAGLRLLVNESALVRVRGQKVQILGTQWGEPGGHSANFERHVPAVAALRQPDAFPILLAHHPHSFDPAAAAGLPLTLSGHTHGGQLMLTPHLGAGSLMYRYWSGPYQNGDARLVVGNGAGNWFPLRINAPAEVIRLTLRRPTD